MPGFYVESEENVRDKMIQWEEHCTRILETLIHALTLLLLAV